MKCLHSFRGGGRKVGAAGAQGLALGQSVGQKQLQGESRSQSFCACSVHVLRYGDNVRIGRVSMGFPGFG